MFNKYNIIYTSTALSIIVAILRLIVIIFTTILVNKYKEKLDKETKKNCYIIAYNMPFAVLQIIFPNISIYPFISVIIITLIYLSFSNPDIDMQKELIRAKESI